MIKFLKFSKRLNYVWPILLLFYISKNIISCLYEAQWLLNIVNVSFNLIQKNLVRYYWNFLDTQQNISIYLSSNTTSLHFISADIHTWELRDSFLSEIIDGNKSRGTILMQNTIMTCRKKNLSRLIAYIYNGI